MHSTEPPISSTRAISSYARSSITSVSDSTKEEPANGSSVSVAHEWITPRGAITEFRVDCGGCLHDDIVGGPDDALYFTNNDFGRIDWDEFWNVVGGNGPCNRERVAARVKAWDERAWVREAALAFAAKHQQQEKVAA